MIKRFAIIPLVLGFINISVYGGEIERQYLANGIPVIFYKLKDVPTASAGILIKGGVLKLKKGNDGLEYLSLKTALSGSKTLGYPDFSKKLKELGIELNISPAREYTLITIRALRKYLDDGIGLVYDGLANPELNQTAFLKIKRQLKKNALQRQESPDSKVWDMVNKIFYDSHPLSTDPRGTVNSIEKLKLQDVAEYLKDIFSSDLFMLCVAGNFAEDTVLKVLNSTFGKIPRKKFPMPSVPPLSPVKHDTMVKDSMMLQTAYFAAKLAAPNPRDPDYFSALLGFSLLGRRLWDTLRTRYGLTYATGAGLSLSKYNYGYLYFSSVKPDSAYILLRREINNVLSKPISDKEVNRARNLWHTYFYMGQASTSSIASYLLRYEYLGLGAEQFLNLPSELEHITPSRIQKALNRYLKNMAMALILPVRK